MNAAANCEPPPNATGQTHPADCREGILLEVEGDNRCEVRHRKWCNGAGPGRQPRVCCTSVRSSKSKVLKKQITTGAEEAIVLNRTPKMSVMLCCYSILLVEGNAVSC